MSDTFSVKAILSAEDSSFRSVFNNAQGVLSNFDSSAGGLLGGLSKITGTVKNGLGFGVLQGIGQKAFGVVADAISGVTSNMGDAIDRYDTLQNFPKVMDMLGFEGAETATKKLSKAIDGLPTSLDGISASTQNIALVNGDLDKATDTAIALNNAFLMSGSSAEEAERGTTQFVQMLSTGKVDMQSWTSLVQNGMGPALNYVAESFGYTGESAKTELYEALKSGKITFSEFNDRLIELNEETVISGKKFKGFAKVAKDATGGIGTAMQNVKTTVVKQLAFMIEDLEKNNIKIADGINAVKDKMNEFGKWFRSSDLFQHLIDSTKTTIEAVKGAIDTFINSSAMKAVYDNMDKIAQNLGVILPNIINGLEPIIEGIATVASKVFGAVSDVIARVTSNPAFMTFCQHIGKAIEKVGKVVEVVIQESSRYFEAIIDAANEVIDAFGKTFDAISKTAEETRLADKVYGNFEKVLGFVKDALIKVAQFLEKHHGLIMWLVEHLPEIITLILGVKAALLVMEKVKGFMTLVDQVKSFASSFGKAVSDVKSGADKIVGFFKNIIGSSKDTGTGFTDFAGVAKSAVGNVEQYLGGMKDTSYTVGKNVSSVMSTSFSDLKDVAGTNISYVVGDMGQLTGKAETVGGNISSSIGGGFIKAQGTATNAVSGIAGAIGGIAAGVGAAVGIIYGIIKAVQQWKEEQYKAGQAMHEMTDEESQFIETSKETCQAYNNMRDAAIDLYGSKEADIKTTELLRDKYLELLDANGNVIAGKEELAEKLAGEMCESLGLEKSKVEELSGEYQNLVDSNGKVKEGYEERADEILGELAQAWGLEKTEVEEIITKNEGLIDIVNDVTEAKRESAKVEAINEAYKQSIQDAINLEKDHKTALELKQRAEQELADFMAENGDNITKYTDKQRGEYDKIIEKIDQYDTALEENEVAQKNNAEVTEIAGDARVAAAEGDAEALELCWARLTEDMKGHTNASKEELQQQLTDAQTYLNERKAAYEKSGSEEDRIELERAQSKRDWAASEYDLLLQNQDGYLTKSLEAQRDAAQKELDEAQAHLDEIILRNRTAADTRYQESTTAAKELVEQKKEALKTIEDDLQASLITQEALESDSLSRQKETTQQETTEKKNIAINNAHDEAEGVQKELSTIPDDTNKIYGETKNNVLSQTQETTKIAGAEAQNTTNAYKNGLFPMESMVGSLADAATKKFLDKANDMKTGAIKSSQDTTKGMVDEFSALPSGLGNKATDAMSMTQQQLIVGQTMLVFSTVGIVSAIIKQFDTLGNRLSSTGANAMIGLNNGLCAQAGKVYSTASAIANNVANTIASALQIHSPSKLTTWMGEMLGQGLVNGLDEYQGKAGKAAKALADTTSEHLKGVNKRISMPDLSSIANMPANIMTHSSFVKDERYNYSSDFHAVIEVPVNLSGREISRVTVDTDSQEQYFNKKRYGR